MLNVSDEELTIQLESYLTKKHVTTGASLRDYVARARTSLRPLGFDDDDTAVAALAMPFRIRARCADREYMQLAVGSVMMRQALTPEARLSLIDTWILSRDEEPVEDAALRLLQAATSER